MGIVREGDWQDFNSSDQRLQELTALVLLDLAAGVHRCVLCRAEQPHDVRWSYYAVEMESQVTGHNTGDLEYRACPTCEPKLDALLFPAERRGR